MTHCVGLPFYINVIRVTFYFLMYNLLHIDSNRFLTWNFRIKIEIKRLYSGNIGKKNIVGSIVFEITSKKSSWERFEIYFMVPKKSKRKRKNFLKNYTI